MARRLILGAIVALGLSAGLCQAQGDAQPPPPNGEITNPLVGQARDLQREVRILQILRALAITPEQGAVIADAQRTLLGAQNEYLRTQEALVAPVARAVEQYVLALLQDAPQAFAQQARADAESLLGKLDQLRTTWGQIRQAQAQRVYGTLTEEQLAGIETPADRINREEGGGPGGVSLRVVVDRILEVRDMDPAVYAERAPQIADEIGASVAGGNPAIAGQMSERIIGLMEEARALRGGLTLAQRSEFTAKVAEQLGLDSERAVTADAGATVKVGCVQQEAFEALLRDPAAYELVVKLYHLGEPAGGTGQ